MSTILQYTVMHYFASIYFHYINLQYQRSVTTHCKTNTIGYPFVPIINLHYKRSNSYDTTRRPASTDRTARRQFQATGQPLSQTQASDAMTSRLPRYEAKSVQRRCFQWGSVPLRSDIKGTELPPANVLIPLERQLIALQLCR